MTPKQILFLLYHVAPTVTYMFPIYFIQFLIFLCPPFQTNLVQNLPPSINFILSDLLSFPNPYSFESFSICIDVIHSFTWLLKSTFILKLCLITTVWIIFLSSEILNAIIAGYKSLITCNLMLFLLCLPWNIM